MEKGNKSAYAILVQLDLAWYLLRGAPATLVRYQVETCYTLAPTPTHYSDNCRVQAYQTLLTSDTACGHCGGLQDLMDL